MHKCDLEIKKHLSHVLPEFEVRKTIILEKRSAEYERKQAVAQAKIEEEKAKCHAATLKTYEEECLWKEAVERVCCEAEELEQKKREEFAVASHLFWSAD
ncbi:hypothetical protein BC827DRAFT_1274626 [Russula dissimulans]|nr:hypothetical protein BC827DRAFT_1274626 [Russula dissimulans]